MYKLYTVSAIKKIKIILVELDLQKKKLLFNKMSKKGLVSVATKLVEKIPDPSKTKEY